MKKGNPKISVVTVCYNAGNDIERTIKSIISQDYDNFEYIIVDGKSTDHTLDIVFMYRDRIDKVISEKDAGIYDAMNKGIDASTGEWIIFINAGDEFFNSKTLSSVFRQKSFNADIIFGDVLNHYQWGYVKQEGRNFNGIESRMPFCHQSAFVRKEIIDKYKFDASFKVCGDHNQFYTMFKEGRKFEHVPLIISIFDTSGVSNYSIQGFKEMSIINDYKGINYIKKFFRAYTKRFLSRLISQKALSLYRFHKYRKNNKIYEISKVVCKL